jgi:16S rRNA processing protein RimM
VEQLTDVPDRFRAGAVLSCDGVGPLTIDGVRPGTKATIVRFRGYQDRAAALALGGKALRVPRDEARRAVGSAYLWADLIGLRALREGGEPLGSVTEVLRAGETDVLVVTDAGGSELLMPALESVVRSVDVAGGTIVLRPQEELA